MSPGRPGAPAAGGLASLRRLTAPPGPPEPPAGPPDGLLSDPLADGPRDAADERCEMCGAGIDERHGHVADTRDHRLLCVCRPCHLLFDRRGAGGVRFRGVGTDVRVVVDPALDPGAWDELQIPVDLVFVLAQSPAETGTDADSAEESGTDAHSAEDERGTHAGSAEDEAARQAFYPGPGGATESLLDLDWWERLVEANPVLAEVQPDVEAVLLRRTGDDVACLVVPVDRCYELVGVVRSHWVGLAGGREVWDRIEAFFDGLAVAGRAVDREGRPLARARRA